MSILKAKNLNRESIFVFLVLGLFCLFLPVLVRESLEKTLFLGSTIIIWAGVFFYTKNLILSSLLYILFVLPFNFTLQLPLVVEIFNTNITLAQPFVEGIYVNYLVPTVSILDVAIFFTLVSIIMTKGFTFFFTLFKSFKNGLLLFLLFLLLQNIILRDLNVLLISFRLLGFLTILYCLVELYGKKIKEKSFRKKLLFFTSYAFLFNILLQGVLGIIQFARGSSVGLFFLGESKVVSGMMGSSFIELANQLFLRAYGTFPHPNVLGAYLILGIFMGILIFRHKESLGLLLIFLSTLFVLFTFSRIGIFLAVVILAGFVVREVLVKRIKPWQRYSFSPLLLLERFTNLFTGGDVSWSERRDLLERSLRVFRENWMLGVGSGNYVKAMEGFVPRTSRGLLLLQPVHNVLLLLLSELGILGFILFLYTLLRLLLENIGKVTILKGLILFTLVVMGLFDHFLLTLPQGLAIFSILFLVCCLNLEGLDENEKNVNKN